MFLRTMHERFGLTVCLLIAFGAFSQNSYAMSCKQNGSIRQDIVLAQPIKVSTANTAPGTLLWRSPTFTSTFECTDDLRKGKSEDANLFWDPKRNMGVVHNSIEVGVTAGNIDYHLINGNKLHVGLGTDCRRFLLVCLAPAQSLSVTVSYSVYIKTTGNMPPSGGRINNTGSYSLFQVDGARGLNTNANQNFNAYISGLGNIRFISCNPTVTVSSNNGRVVNFGSIPRQNAEVGKVEKQIPFAVSVDMSDPDSGQDCQGQVLQASFSSPNLVLSNAAIMPARDSGFAIQLSHQATPQTYIRMNTPLNMGLVNGSNVTENFLANLIWISTNPRVGPFSASANVDVTIK